MLAYKFLEGRRSPFTGQWWPSPAGPAPGAWLEASGPLALCANGIHACTVAQLPPWLGADLWAVELDGEIVDAGVALVASRGRLVEPVAGWDPDAHVRFAGDCAARARPAAAARPDLGPLLEAITGLVGSGQAAAAGYWSAVVAGRAAAGGRAGAAYDEAFAAERAVQAEWLSDRLALR